jgi:hypothetical protein
MLKIDDPKIFHFNQIYDILNKMVFLKKEGYYFCNELNLLEFLSTETPKTPSPLNKNITPNFQSSNPDIEKITKKLIKENFVDNDPSLLHQLNNSIVIRLIRQLLIFLGIAEALYKRGIDISNETPIKTKIAEKLENLINEIDNLEEKEKEFFFKNLNDKLYDKLSLKDLHSVNILLNIFKNQLNLKDKKTLPKKNNETLNALIKTFENHKNLIKYTYPKIPKQIKPTIKHIYPKIPENTEIPLIQELSKESKKIESLYSFENNEVTLSQSIKNEKRHLSSKFYFKTSDDKIINLQKTKKIHDIVDNFPKNIKGPQKNIALNFISTVDFDGMIGELLKNSEKLPEFFKGEIKIENNFTFKFVAAACEEKIFYSDSEGNLKSKIKGYLKFPIEYSGNVTLLKTVKFSLEFSLKDVFENETSPKSPTTITFKK